VFQIGRPIGGVSMSRSMVIAVDQMVVSVGP